MHTYEHKEYVITSGNSCTGLMTVWFSLPMLRHILIFLLGFGKNAKLLTFSDVSSTHIQTRIVVSTVCPVPI